ncbi:MAG: hypothetical protein F6K11_28370 [Leptolyngbya sp. SIO3F4]|nr:hypothetical protein [Leptolyngbya sp. SIO3F4]
MFTVTPWMSVKTILALAANPTDTSRLRLEKEVKEIQSWLRRRLVVAGVAGLFAMGGGWYALDTDRRAEAKLNKANDDLVEA